MQWLSLILLIPYLYLLLKVYYSLRRIRTYIPQKPSHVFVSVIVACRNEEASLPSLLSGLAAQDYSQELFEVIIIDDNSTDTTYKTASCFTGIKKFQVIKNFGTGKKKAIKTGVDACAGELVITTDADCRPGKSWLKTIASFYTENKPGMIICPVEMNGTGSFLQMFQELEFLSLQGVTAGTAAAGNPVMCNGANLAFTKEVFQKYSGNLHEDKVSGDDVFLLHNLKRNKGNRILWLESPEAIVATATSAMFSSFLRQRARWLSKAGSYSDRYTIILAIVTFVTILIQPLFLIAGIFDPVFVAVFLAAYILKSIPDFLILRNTAIRYKKKSLMRWFVPSQILYAYYILRVVPKAICSGNRWD